MKTSQTLGESPREGGARLRMTLISLGRVSEAWLLLTPHPHPWPKGTILPVSQPFPPPTPIPRLELPPTETALLLPNLVYGHAGRQLLLTLQAH